jgi:hypothetical protein
MCFEWTYGASLPNQTIPGAVFYGTSPGGYTTTPPANYRFVWDPKKIVIPVGREFTNYNMKPFARALNWGAFQASKVPTFAFAVPAATYAAGALGKEVWRTGTIQPLGEFGEALSGVEGSPPSPTGGGQFRLLLASLPTVFAYGRASRLGSLLERPVSSELVTALDILHRFGTCTRRIRIGQGGARGQLNRNVNTSDTTL